MGFIPDRGVSNKKEDTDTAVIATKPGGGKRGGNKTRNARSPKEKKKEKKIVSYYLETDLVNKIKSRADKKDMYYSALVTLALKNWMTKNN